MLTVRPDYFVLVGELLGGLGLFILAMKLMTEGLKAAVAERLRDILGRWTSTRMKGIFTGAAITAIVQSSSAVTVATIGFVNASMLSLKQALSVVFGANVGTTMTGWLVSLVGFNLKVEAFALPMIGIGTGLWLIGQARRFGGVGEALLGFGLFFLGLEILKQAFDGLAPVINLQVIADYGTGGVVLLVLAGMLMTVLTQSSSAAVAITLTAAAGGVITVASAAAVVIGANVGTTSTALFASIGATPAAKRVALAHVLFNGITGVIALAILPMMLWGVDMAESMISDGGNAALTLALFHTAFNVIGVLAIAPFSGRMAGYLETRFRTAAEDASRPAFLDENVLQTPVLALDALYQETVRAAEMAVGCAREALDARAGPSPSLHARAEAVRVLRSVITAFSSRLGGGRLSPEMHETLAIALRAAQHLEDVTDAALACAPAVMSAIRLGGATLKQPLDDFLHACRALTELAGTGPAMTVFPAVEAALDEVETRHKVLRKALLEAGIAARIAPNEINVMLDDFVAIRRLCRRVSRLIERLASLQERVQSDSQPDPDQSSPNR